MHVIAAEEHSLKKLPLHADRQHLTSRVHQLIGIVRQEIEVQSKPCKLLAVEVAPAGPDRYVTSGQLRSWDCSWIHRHRKARTNQAGWEACLPRCRGVGCQAVESVHEVTGNSVRS